MVYALMTMKKCFKKEEEKKNRGKQDMVHGPAGSRSYVLIQHWERWFSKKRHEDIVKIVKHCFWGERGEETAIKFKGCQKCTHAKGNL